MHQSSCTAQLQELQEIIDDANDKLFSKIHNNPSHVLSLFLHERRSQHTIASSQRIYTRRVVDRTLSQRSSQLCVNNVITGSLLNT